MALHRSRIWRHGTAHVQAVVRVHVLGGTVGGAGSAAAHARLVKLDAVRAEIARVTVPVRRHDCS